MGLTIEMFENPPRIPVPTAEELRVLSDHASKSEKAHRVELMNTIGHLIGIPTGGWNEGQSRLFVGDDVRLIRLLRRLTNASLASRVSTQLTNVRRFVDADTMLTIVVTNREHDASLGDLSSRPIDTYDEGGLDYLWDSRNRLGLPPSVTGNWRQAPPGTSQESGKEVRPAIIPARDAILAYAAQINASFNNVMQAFRTWGRDRKLGTWGGSRVATMVWKSLAFLAPGGTSYSPDRSVESQLGQKFGTLSMLQYLASLPAGTLAPNRQLDAILTVQALNRSEWVRIAKCRVAEALFLERLLWVTRNLIL